MPSEERQRGLTSRIPIWLTVSGVMALALVALVVSSMWGGGNSPDSHDGGGQMRGMDHGAPTASAAPSEPDPTADPAQVVTVAMEDMAFKPVAIEVERGAAVRLEFDNTGELLHDFTIDDIAVVNLRFTVNGTPMPMQDMQVDDDHAMDSAMHLALDPGTSGAVEFRASESGEYEFYCAEPGHRDAGMFGELRVVVPSSEETPLIDGGPSGGPGEHPRSDGSRDH